MRNLVLAAVFAFAIALVLYLPDAHAAPTFARQTGMACNACHYQHFPTLNAFGRAFKEGGYTLAGGQSMVEGEVLSMPAVLNASLMAKIRYQKTNGPAGMAGTNLNTSSGTNKGELQFPDEAALLIGGRAGEHVGFILEASLTDADAPSNGGSRFTQFKAPFVYKVQDVNLSVIPFTTTSAGPSYGFELLNTGVVNMISPVEHGNETSAFQYISTGTMATGFSFVAAESRWFANYTIWSPVHGNTDAGPYLNYMRAAVTPTLAGWDLGVGGALWDGTTKYGATPTRQSAKAWGVDAQAQGTAGPVPLGLYLAYGIARKSKDVAGNTSNDMRNIFNATRRENKKAWSAIAEIGILPQRLTFSAGYLAGKNGSLNENRFEGNQNATTVGLTYQIAQNVQLQLNNSWYSGNAFDTKWAATNGDRLTTLMLFAAF